MLENSEIRSEVFYAIAKNNNYMTGFIENMQENDHEIQMMKGNQLMMGNMMDGKMMYNNDEPRLHEVQQEHDGQIRIGHY